MLATLVVTLPGIARCRFPNANMVNKLGTAYPRTWSTVGFLSLPQ
jgi:hypothetical protein